MAVGLAAVLTLARLVRRESPQHALSGLIGVAFAAFIATRSGRAEDFFLPGLLANAGYATAFLVSIAVRWPLVGWIWSVVLDKGSTRWRDDPVLLRTFGWLTGLWAVIYLAKVGIQSGLYLANQDAWLGIARIALGWPPYALLLAVTVWSVRRVTRHQSEG